MPRLPDGRYVFDPATDSPAEWLCAHFDWDGAPVWHTSAREHDAWCLEMGREARRRWPGYGTMPAGVAGRLRGLEARRALKAPGTRRRPAG